MSTNFITTVTKDLVKLAEIVDKVDTLAAVSAEYGYSSHGRYTKIIRQLLTDYDLDFSHFRDGSVKKKDSYIKHCPQCGNTFAVFPGRDGDKKVTCSRQCANKYFSWKQGTKNYIGSINNSASPLHYRNVLFSFLESNNLHKECIVCGETEVLDVHHIDEDRNNNAVTNLVCLCPTHHYAYHRYNSSKVTAAILDYISTNYSD